MKRKVFTLIGLVCAVLGAYLFVVNDESDAPKTSETENIKELVHNYSAGNIEDQSASITSHQLLVTDSDGVELTYDLPEDDFFVSIAPYMDKTHP
jgi:hypothetical protein